MYSKNLYILIKYKYLLSIAADAKIKTVKECERISLEIVYPFVSGMLSADITV